MAPVVRVSDDVFRRLQRISEPLVDTPSQVIDRILAHYEAAIPLRAETSRGDSHSARAAEEREAESESPHSINARLFIAPASDANLNRTVRNLIPLASVEPLLTSAQVAELRPVIGAAAAFHCWAMTESRRPVFDAMRQGDVVVLITPGTAFTGRVQYKLISERLGAHLWASQPRLPWKFIYLLTDIREARVRKDRLSRALGYKPSHAFPGVSRVRPEALRSALDVHGTIEKLLAACA